MFGGGLNNKKHVQFFKCWKNILSTSALCINDYNKILKWFQIHGILNSWLNKHDSTKLIIISLNTIEFLFFIAIIEHFASFYCDCTLFNDL
jgi:hypothetical protein